MPIVLFNRTVFYFYDPLVSLSRSELKTGWLEWFASVLGDIIAMTQILSRALYETAWLTNLVF